MKLYNIIAHVPNNTEVTNGYIKYRNINSLERWERFLNKKFPTWRFYNVYEKESKDLLKTIKKGAIK